MNVCIDLNAFSAHARLGQFCGQLFRLIRLPSLFFWRRSKNDQARSLEKKHVISSADFENLAFFACSRTPCSHSRLFSFARSLFSIGARSFVLRRYLGISFLPFACSYPPLFIDTETDPGTDPAFAHRLLMRSAPLPSWIRLHLLYILLVLVSKPIVGLVEANS